MATSLARRTLDEVVKVGAYQIRFGMLGADIPAASDEADVLAIAEKVAEVIHYSGQMIAWWKINFLRWLRDAGVNYGPYAADMGLTKKTAMHYIDASRIAPKLRRDDVSVSVHILVSRFWQEPETVARLLAEAAGCNLAGARWMPDSAELVDPDGVPIRPTRGALTVREVEDKIQVLQEAGRLGNGAPDTAGQALTNGADPAALPGESELAYMLDVATVEGWDSLTTARSVIEWLTTRAPDSLIASVIRKRAEVAHAAI